MSVLTSKDLHIVRSSTRLHAPPGGHSSFSLSYGFKENDAPRNNQRYVPNNSFAISKPQEEVNMRSFPRSNQSSVTFGDANRDVERTSKPFPRSNQSSISFGDADRDVERTSKPFPRSNQSSIVFGDAERDVVVRRRPVANMGSFQQQQQQQQQQQTGGRMRPPPGGHTTIVIG